MYTNTWSSTIPLGTDQAKTIDNHIRQLRLDLQERFLTIIDDLDADPWELKGSVLGTGDKKVIIPGSCCVGGSDSMNHRADYEDIYGSYVELFTSNVPDGYFHMLPAVIGVGKQIKLLELLGNKTDTDGIKASIYKRDFVAGGTSQSATLVGTEAIITTSGVQIASSDVIAETIEEDVMYWVAVRPFIGSSSSVDVIGVRITYGEPV
jgi:hypothetical protein